MQDSTNLVLAALAPSDRERIFPFLERAAFARGACVLHAHRPIEHVHFIEDGIASMLSARAVERRAEVGLIGREGLCGAAGLLMAEQAAHDVVVQVDDARTLRIPLDVLQDQMAESPSLRRVILRYIQALFVQVGSNAIANLSDRLDVRLARWLLMCHDRIDGDIIQITHEYTAVMLGSHRSAVTSALHVLEGERLIQTERGSIRVVDRRGLEDAAQDTYGFAEAEYRRLVAPLGKGCA